MRYAPIWLLPIVAFGCATMEDPRLRAAQERVAAEELVLAEFQHGGFDLLLDQATQAGMDAMRPILEKELGRELSRSEDQKLARLFRASLSEVYPREAWVDALERVYVKHLTLDEMRAILEFYRTPAGRRLLKVQPTLEAEAEAAGQRLVASRQEEFQKRFEAGFAAAFEQSGTSTSPGAASSALSIAEAIQACRAIHSAAEIPIGCEFDYMEGRPSLFVALPTLDTVDEYWGPMSDNVASPFCSSANAANRQALVFVSVVDTEVARIYSCESDEWSDWFSLSDQGF